MMNSQFNINNSQKVYQNDYTNVSTQNSSQHSINSNEQIKNYQHQKTLYQISIQQSTLIQETHQGCQNNLQDTEEDKSQFYKKSITWLAKKYKKFKIKIQTLYLAISYLIKFINQVHSIKYRSEIIASVCLLLASKMNEIHVPSIKLILSNLQFKCNKKQFINIQHQILQLFEYQIGLQNNSYSLVHLSLANQQEEKRRNAEKLLFLSLCNLNTLEYGEIYLAWGIIYLIRPELIQQNQNIDRQKIKKIAFLVYKIYKQKKQTLKTENSKKAFINV